MAIPSFFKQNKPRGFNYVPRYYDPAKEELEQRRRAWGAEKEALDEGPGAQRSEHEAQGTSADNKTAKDGASSAKATDFVRRSGLRPAESEGRAQGEEHLASSATTRDGASQPYRSTIMRGDMRNHFQRRKERVERHTTIRLLVIIIIIVLVVYLYLRF